MAHADRSASRRAGPRGGWLFGSTRELRRDPLGLLLRAREQYGDVVRFRYFGPLAWHFFAHPRDVEHILVSHLQRFPKGVFGRVLDLIIPNGLASTDDDVWARQRRLVQPGFHTSLLPDLASTIVEVTEHHLARWVDATRDGRPIDLEQACLHLSLDVAGRTLLGSDLREATEVVDRYAKLALEQLNYRVLHPLSPLPFLPTPKAMRYRDAVRRVDRTLTGIVERRRAQPGGSRDLLGMLLAAGGDDERGLSDVEIRDQVKTLLISGYETTGATLGWFWYCLAGRPDVEARVREEIRAVVGDRLPRMEDLQALAYTRQVLNETLRLYPPAPWLGRQARDACEVNGHPVGRGAVVCVSPFVTHRHPEFWDEPDRFDPEHFSPAAVRQRPKTAFFPFGTGPRYCVGQAFATMEMLLVISTVLPRWRFTLEPGAVVRPQVRGTLQTAFGLPMAMAAATPASAGTSRGLSR
jgi:cytochrome P450